MRLVLGILATWRITHLLANEDGPLDLIIRFRALLGSGLWGKLLDCFQCLSLWVAAPIAFFIARRPLDLIFVWLAISGAACLLERAGRDSLVIQPLSQPEGETDIGMLRSETSELQNLSVTGDDSSQSTGN